MSTIFHLCMFSKNQVVFSVVEKTNNYVLVQANHSNAYANNCVVGLGYPYSGIVDIVQALNNNVATNNRMAAHNGIPAQWNATDNDNRLLLFENLGRLIQQPQQGNVFVYSQSTSTLDSACTHVKIFIVRRDMFEVLANIAEALSISETQNCPMRSDAVVPEEFQFLLQATNETSCLLRLAKHYLEYDRQLQKIEANNNNNNNNNNYQVERISHRDFLRDPNETLKSLCTSSLDCRKSHLDWNWKRQKPVKRKGIIWSTKTMSQLQNMVHVNNEACSNSPAGWTPSGPFTVYSSRRRSNNPTTTGVDTNLLSNFLRGPGLEPSKENTTTTTTTTTTHDPAICVFTGGQFHFPHAMEQLYSCFSWWQAHPEKKPVLVYNSTKAFPSGYMKKGHRHRSSFVRGLLEHFELAFGVEIVSNTSSTSTSSHAGFVVRGNERLSKYGNFSIRGFQMRGPQDALALSLGVLRYNNRTLTVQAAAAARKKSLMPRVAILNRGYRHDKPSRSLLNANQVTQALKLASQNETLYSVAPVTYFESASFLDQVDFYSSIDIVVSPHGAQLTGIAFMSSTPCGSVLELFPKGYSIPEYFGSLATSSGQHHSYFYMSQGNEMEENAMFMRGFENREASRRVDFCGTPSRIADAVRLLVEEWKQCQEIRSSDS
jgi:hypothetical protein